MHLSGFHAFSFCFRTGRLSLVVLFNKSLLAIATSIRLIGGQKELYKQLTIPFNRTQLLPAHSAVTNLNDFTSLAAFFPHSFNSISL